MLEEENAKHSSLWHPWTDKPGQRHTPVLWGQELSDMSIEDLVQTVAKRQMYIFTNDILDEQQVTDGILRHPKSEPYISRTGKIVALRLTFKGKSGFLIPGTTWGCRSMPDERLLKNVNRIFKLFGYEALTPASLSEKVARSTLPPRTFISRPSDMLRRSLLDNSYGGRIDSVKFPKWYEKVYSYDQTKSYLYHSVSVPSPFISPVYLYYGTCSGDTRWREEWASFASSWIKCILTAHISGIQPIQIKDEETGLMRAPIEGECFTRWLWDNELRDCLEAGYTLEHIERGYGWTENSNFLAQWADTLWYKLDECHNKEERDLIKSMMVGLPGRFLKSPETFTLKHISEYPDGIIPDTDSLVLRNWNNGGPVTSDWFIHPDYDVDSAQLTPQGHRIVVDARQEIYHKMKEEERKGNEVIRSYIDCYSVAQATMQPEILGKERGDFKEEIDTDVWVEENRVIPALFSRLKASGFTGYDRHRLWDKYHA